jgi:hypothetical protein
MQSEGHTEEVTFPMDWKDRRLVALIVLSILAFIGWLVFILFYALFWSTGFTLFQNIIVTIVSFLVTGGVVGILWVVLGMKYAKPAKA